MWSEITVLDASSFVTAIAFTIREISARSSLVNREIGVRYMHLKVRETFVWQFVEPHGRNPVIAP